jgi:hypothetical protein
VPADKETVKKPPQDAKGHFQGAGPGRPKGSQNKATALAREAIARFVDENAERCQEWLDAIAADEGPRAAFTCYMQLVEFHVPKLARTELTGEDGGPVKTTVNVILETTSPANG